ncbi:glycosyltransferase involved in cell wall biosynthesis [Mycolicibacterium sp. BK556]|uniref:glycosyltransferase family 2 protein n=1 Tax=unclassified Mycolicibacterium TaxID=2636767 RepID=UPI00160FA5EC|nr:MULTISPECIES: glycosyltransferase [unclassified Mycolicibacterium]MBB3607021.1 glycosyltransferase involved in cell wall biosynthesis [Mycolicibacterium sp. BK556]MBB3636766.1 glycosyltransferase involved in cell wall biosynthesis [Mycolicibacterium sp. BK607]MBB3747567.1 glycosyltransferase involved in cell wall biosynthesis [Mycolicibacterium sp. BK634]
MSEIKSRRVSAVIRAYNESKHIGRLLKGLAQQTVKPDEIILVDSGSTDDTVAIAEAAGCRIVHIAKEEFSFGRALNRGCAAAEGDILLFASAHVYPVYNTYVEHIVNAFDRRGVAIAYGRQVGDERTKFSESRVMLKWFPHQNIWDQGHPFSNNANAAVLKSVWEEMPYDESLTGLEDLDFAKKALTRGYKISYVADAPVVHVHEESWSIIRNRYRREAMAYARIVEGAKMTLPNAVGLALSNIASDYKEAVKVNRLRSNVLSIPQFRFAQFIGAWEGFRAPDHVTAGLRERFYYPADSRSADTPAEPGLKIEYSEDS